jgi:hypothetical protein
MYESVSNAPPPLLVGVKRGARELDTPFFFASQSMSLSLAAGSWIHDNVDGPRLQALRRARREVLKVLAAGLIPCRYPNSLHPHTCIIMTRERRTVVLRHAADYER